MTASSPFRTASTARHWRSTSLPSGAASSSRCRAWPPRTARMQMPCSLMRHSADDEPDEQMNQRSDSKRPTTKGRLPVRRLYTTMITLSVAGLLGVSACGSDDKKSDATTATTMAPEDVKVDAATVKAGLTKLPATIATAIAAIGTPDAKTKLDAI